jgi:hypothetical protein
LNRFLRLMAPAPALCLPRYRNAEDAYTGRYEYTRPDTYALISVYQCLALRLSSSPRHTLRTYQGGAIAHVGEALSVPLLAWASAGKAGFLC